LGFRIWVIVKPWNRAIVKSMISVESLNRWTVKPWNRHFNFNCFKELGFGI